MEHRRTIALMASGHGCADLCQGAVPALLPFLIAQRGLSLTAATALLSAATIGASIVQPLFGLWADRLSAPVLMPIGVAVGSIGIGLVGLVHSYVALALVLALSGLGVAAFHPEGARTVNRLSRPATRGRAMSVFSVGGNAGFAVGPILVTAAVGVFGLAATPLIALPGLVVAVALARATRSLHAAAVAGPISGPVSVDGPGGSATVTVTPAEAAPVAVEQWGAFARLSTAAVARTVVFFAMQAFVPIYLVDRFSASPTLGNAGLTLLLVAGAAGTLIGGRCADRFGRKVVLVYAMAPAVVVLALAPHVGLVGFVLALIAVGLLLDGPFSITVVLGQEYLPGRVGLASGITLGLAIGLGGLGATGLGALADATSIPTALDLLPVFALAALVLALSLPETVRARASRRSARATTPA